MKNNISRRKIYTRRVEAIPWKFFNEANVLRSHWIYSFIVDFPNELVAFCCPSRHLSNLSFVIKWMPISDINEQTLSLNRFSRSYDYGNCIELD